VSQSESDVAGGLGALRAALAQKGGTVSLVLRGEEELGGLPAEPGPPQLAAAAHLDVAVDPDGPCRQQCLDVTTGVGGRAISEDRLCVVEAYQDWDGAIGAFVVAVIAGLVIDALYRLIDNRLKVNDFAIASLAACYLVFALMPWLLGGGINALVHSSVIFGSLSGYLLLRFAPTFGVAEFKRLHP